MILLLAQTLVYAVFKGSVEDLNSGPKKILVVLVRFVSNQSITAHSYSEAGRLLAVNLKVSK